MNQPIITNASNMHPTNDHAAGNLKALTDTKTLRKNRTGLPGKAE